MITESDDEPVDVVATLRAARADVLICYLPVGSEDAARFYAQCAIDAGVAFVNALPVFIASTPEWAQKFTDAGLPIIGDDIKSQVGATITHRVMAKLFEDRGVELLRTYQLNFGGNMDFMNMLERKRLQSKKISKTQSVTSQIPHEMAKADVHIGPSDHVPWLDDRKWAYVRLEGRSFGDTPLNLEYKLEVWDSPNSAGVIIDAVRAAKIAHGPRHRRPDPLGVVVLHEVPAGAVLRRGGARGRRGVHRRRRSSADRTWPRGGRPAPQSRGRALLVGAAGRAVIMKLCPGDLDDQPCPTSLRQKFMITAKAVAGDPLCGRRRGSGQRAAGDERRVRVAACGRPPEAPEHTLPGCCAKSVDPRPIGAEPLGGTLTALAHSTADLCGRDCLARSPRVLLFATAATCHARPTFGPSHHPTCA